MSQKKSTVSIHRFEDRLKLDRRRFEEGHLKYCVLEVYKKYPDTFSKLTFKSSLQQTLDEVTASYYTAFSTKYASHRCGFPGCGKVLVLDGNLKNRRDVCAATEAGYIEYSSLPGTIKSGCQLSPCATSKFCYLHAPRISGRDSLEGHDLEFVTAFRETRSGKYYKVVTITSEDEVVAWKHSSEVCTSLIDDYEKSLGIVTDKKYDIISHCIASPKNLDLIDSPLSKRRKRSEWEDGAFADQPLSISTCCNTEKDKNARLHDRTSGVLAAMFPCGIIVALSELFRAESKSQVYGVIHEFLSNHPNVAANLKFICYDDGCHLRKYAQNESRKDITSVTKQLAALEIVVDKLHMKGHTDAWCKKTCDPNLFPELNDVDTEVCEQCFSWLSRYARARRRMSRSNFLFFVLYLCDMHNLREEKMLIRSGYMN